MEPRDSEAPNSQAEEERARRRAARRARLHAQVFDTTVPSPCIAICQMDEDSQYCIGCHRTLDEIREWMIMTAEQKRAALARIEAARGKDDADDKSGDPDSA